MSIEILDPRRTVVFAGDSVTDCGRRTDPEALGDGYVRDLWNDLRPQRPRIVNVGISGNRAVDLRERWATDVLAHEPDLVSVLIGINDTWRRYDEDDPTSTEEFEAAYWLTFGGRRFWGAECPRDHAVRNQLRR
jgi:lysophospholipase L1-like esterase